MLMSLQEVAVTWIYADRLKADPESRLKVKGRISFAFLEGFFRGPDIITDAALSEFFDKVCPKNPRGNPVKNSLMSALLSRVA